MTTARDLVERLDAGFAGVLVGSDALVFGLNVALLARGHALIEGVPGTGKTLAVRAMAALLGVQYRRIQFTPDLMPADVVGTTIFNPATAQFSMRAGPVVTNVLLADEINRTPAKTQSALLEAMEEGRITIDGLPVQLPRPFFVCATQNPIEYEGTYPLPEAQLDRFLLKIPAPYPSPEQELLLLERVTAGFDARAVDQSSLAPVADAQGIVEAQEECRRVRAEPALRAYIFHIVAETRTNPHVALGASPRAGVALLAAAQAAAAIDGRDYITPDDVKDVAPLVIPHRLLVRPQAEIDGVSGDAIVAHVLETVPVPREASS